MEPINWIVGLSNLGCGLLCVVLGVPLMRGRVRPNRWYGVRFKRSFESDELWYAINEHGGRWLVYWSIPIALSGLAVLLLPLGESAVVAVAFLPMLYLVGALQTWFYARDL